MLPLFKLLAWFGLLRMRGVSTLLERIGVERIMRIGRIKRIGRIGRIRGLRGAVRHQRLAFQRWVVRPGIRGPALMQPRILG